jgi:hypothetical protein
VFSKEIEGIPKPKEKPQRIYIGAFFWWDFRRDWQPLVELAKKVGAKFDKDLKKWKILNPDMQFDLARMLLRKGEPAVNINMYDFETEDLLPLNIWQQRITTRPATIQQRIKVEKPKIFCEGSRVRARIALKPSGKAVKREDLLLWGLVSIGCEGKVVGDDFHLAINKQEAMDYIVNNMKEPPEVIGIPSLLGSAFINSMYSDDEVFPHQKTGINFLYSRHRAILSDEMGLGKSAQAIMAAEQIKADGLADNIVIVCPVTLQANWTRELKKWNSSYEKVIIIPYSMLHKIETKDIPDNSVIIMDECFAKGTMIDTPYGKKPIENIEIGDKIINCTGVDRVVACSSSTKKDLITINNITCTGNHPFFTTRGWVLANNLQIGDTLVATNETMRMVRNRNCNKKESFLREVLFSEMENVTARNKSKSLQCRSYCENSSKNHWSNSSRSIGMAQKKQLYVQKEDKGKGFKNIKENWTSAICSWRKWKRPNKTRTISFKYAWRKLELQSSSNVKQTPIQNRCGKSFIKNSDRSRWIFSFIFNQKRARREEREMVKGIRVESIKIEKSGSRTTYNLQIERHPSYSVNGILVHNCHYLKNATSRRTQCAIELVDSCKDKIVRLWLLTGTPVTKDNSDLWSTAMMLNHPLKKMSPLRLAGMKGDNNAILSGAFKTHMLMRKKEDCLNLPPKIRQTIDVNTNMAKYVDVSILKKGNVDAIMEHLMKLKRMSAEAKIEAAIEFVEPLIESGHKVVLFSDHTSPLHKIHEHFGDASVLLDGTTKQRDRDTLVQKFQNDDSCRLFCGNIKAAGVGITLTASTIVVFVDLTWLPSDIAQAEDRCHRIGTTGTVNVYYLTDPDLITDCIILRILGNRSGEIASFEGAKATILSEVQSWVDRNAE